MVEITVAYYLGIDGGGTKTTCAVGDEHSVLASSTAGPSNITRVGEKRARESIHQAIRSTCEAAKLSPSEIKRVCIGAAGAAREEAATALRKFSEELIHGEIEVVGDMAISMEAAFGAGPGVIVIAGTGSIAYGRNIHGATARAGGWGFAIGDEGSAHWIGRKALSQLLRAVDERAKGSLSQNIAQADFISGSLFRELMLVWKVDSLEELARRANSDSDFSALFPAVLASADSGDDLAREVLEKAATQLLRLAAIVIRRLFPEGDDVTLAMAGGVFRHSKTIRQLFCDQVLAAHPKAILNQELVEPVHGALKMARKPKG